MGIGYILLSGILACEWGMCAALSGTLWTDASEHLFNNFISNAANDIYKRTIEKRSFHMPEALQNIFGKFPEIRQRQACGIDFPVRRHAGLGRFFRCWIFSQKVSYSDEKCIY